jgi:alkylation response protein AidB-like acyl-CoA dehydrogenase
MNFDFTDVQASWKEKGAALGRDLAGEPAAADVIMGAARVGLLDPAADLLAAAAAVEAMAFESASAAVVFALHSGTALAFAGNDHYTSLFRGEAVAAVSLSSDDMPIEQHGKLLGRAPWVAPITDRGIAVVGPRTDSAERTAYVVALETPGVSIDPVQTSALRGVVCGHVNFANAACTPVGATLPIMIRLRTLIAAAGLGMGRRALREALDAAKRTRAAAAWEETVQGLLADAATELDAAMLMTWKAAVSARPSLPDASLAKLASTVAAQRAVERATQVVGADSFQHGNIIAQLAQDVRALELFAGRTEALREAVAETL